MASKQTKLICFLSILFVTIYQVESVKNVLLLVADDAGFEMGAYLNKYCQTPNLDALAKDGLLFNNAFTSVSSCSPSRAQILTGQASHQNGMYGLHQGVHNFDVFKKVTSLPNVLRKSDKNILTGIIGKKHVGAGENFKFDYEQTEENHSINQIGRNISNIKLYVNDFLGRAVQEEKPFFLVVGFHDPHRCGHITPQFGEFCERWGSGEEGMGVIPDWRPIYYDWRNLKIPDWMPQTETVQKELAAQYMTISRLDQGVGLVLKELRSLGLDKETLVIYTSDNGPPFPSGRTNLYDRGVREPMIISSPDTGKRKNQVTSAMTSLLDVFPTVLDVFGIKTNASYTGKSLLPLLDNEPEPNNNDTIFGSQNFHEITMNYPMRMIRNRRYKLIHNLNYWSYFPIDQDLYTSPTFQEILNATIMKQKLPWVKSLESYYKRPEWELYDLKMDPLERWNLASKAKFSDLFKNMKLNLFNWQVKTNDPWRCSPHAVLQEQGIYKKNPACLTLGHEDL
ncbi:N-sulphoglucosamine sulphohydrolase [Episyrphus balteatus]|uniref:N-sulphoglucosamine sulphohydrolase n=1 Tax=Episyrphus balteatus TaxID=286459 RepID=UPI0024864B8A|nr:N-sulphoglucosamine sulphohydrolase [Episyrphus balteatus]